MSQRRASRSAPARRGRQRGPQRGHQCGAALLLAMIVLVLVATATAGMVWQQTRAVNIEAAERARAQAAWILNGALDWARLILREDQRAGQQNNNAHDHLGEPWAQPLAEARLSSFLAADKDNNTEGGPEAFISGRIEDAQSRLNLTGLIDAAGKPLPLQRAALERLVTLAGAPTDTATRVVQALIDAQGGASADNPAGPPLKPSRLSDLAWAGLDEPTLQRLAPFVDLLPVSTPVNVNTASREVIAALIDGLGLGGAERLVQARARKPFEKLQDVQDLLAPTAAALDPAQVSVGSSFFWVAGRLRLEERVLEERSLLVRRATRVDVLHRERRNLALGQR